MGKTTKKNGSPPNKPNETSSSGSTFSVDQNNDLRITIRGYIREELRDLLRDEFQAVNNKLQGVMESMSFISQQYDSIRESLSNNLEKIQTLIAERDALKITVGNLSDRVRLMEQHMRESNLELNGIPEHKNEVLTNVLDQLAEVVKDKLEPNDMVFCKRVAKLNKDSKNPRAVVVKMRSPLRRDTLLASIIRFNKQNPLDRLNSHHLGYGGEKKPIFVMEHLSPENKALHAETRIKAKERGYKFTWVRNGCIYVRKDENCQAILIRSLDKLNSL